MHHVDKPTRCNLQSFALLFSHLSEEITVIMSSLSRLYHVSLQHLPTHPLTRGMLMYSVTWTLGCSIQQTIESKEYNLSRTLIFGLYGTFYVAPTLYGWMRFACIIWPKPTLVHSITKAVVEAATFSPLGISSFLFIVSFLEGESLDSCIEEVKNKLIPTWKISASIWPIIQIVNYSIIPERNRIPFIGMCSLFWTVFLAFVKHHKKERQRQIENNYH